jgi:hypothetical protein
MEQVGVNAPGTDSKITFLPENSSSVVRLPGPSAVITPKDPDGILSPFLIATFAPFSVFVVGHMNYKAIKRIANFNLAS